MPKDKHFFPVGKDHQVEFGVDYFCLDRSSLVEAAASFIVLHDVLALAAACRLVRRSQFYGSKSRNMFRMMRLLLLFVRAPRSRTSEGTRPGKRIAGATYPYTLGLINIFAIHQVCSSCEQIMEMKCSSMDV
jgi:hypothetical protein